MEEGGSLILKFCFIFKICNHNNSGITVLIFFGNFLLQNEIQDMRLQR